MAAFQVIVRDLLSHCLEIAATRSGPVGAGHRGGDGRMGPDDVTVATGTDRLRHEGEAAYEAPYEAPTAQANRGMAAGNCHGGVAVDLGRPRPRQPSEHDSGSRSHDRLLAGAPGPSAHGGWRLLPGHPRSVHAPDQSDGQPEHRVPRL